MRAPKRRGPSWSIPMRASCTWWAKAAWRRAIPSPSGREGLSFRGTGVIGRKAEWPSWQPTAQHDPHPARPLRRLCRRSAGRADEPAWARGRCICTAAARDTMFRIHGTSDAASIGHATCAGCIRLFNQDAIDLYNRVPNGTPGEGAHRGGKPGAGRPADGRRLWPHRARDAREHRAEGKGPGAIAKQAEKDRVAAEKAEKKRLAACATPRHRAGRVPPPGTPGAVVTVGTSDAATVRIT